jgi:hypothetical protein
MKNGIHSLDGPFQTLGAEKIAQHRLGFEMGDQVPPQHTSDKEPRLHPLFGQNTSDLESNKTSGTGDKNLFHDGGTLSSSAKQFPDHPDCQTSGKEEAGQSDHWQSFVMGTYIRDKDQ